jgi:undecaprenyl-diphosphatase
MSFYSTDAAITHAINELAGQNSLLDLLVVWISSVGVPLLILLVAIQWWLHVDKEKDRHAILSAGLSFLIGLGLNQLILLFVHRMRPYDGGITHLIIAPSADFSFPSDHATAAFAIAAAFLLCGLSRRGLWFSAAAILIAISRVYIGTHYVSDILGGALTATIAAVFVRCSFRPQSRFNRFLSSLF